MPAKSDVKEAKSTIGTGNCQKLCTDGGAEPHTPGFKAGQGGPCGEGQVYVSFADCMGADPVPSNLTPLFESSCPPTFSFPPIQITSLLKKANWASEGTPYFTVIVLSSPVCASTFPVDFIMTIVDPVSGDVISRLNSPIFS